MKRPCSHNNTYTSFYLHLTPIDESVLPSERRSREFDELKFDFDQNGFRDDGSCVTRFSLPEYEISRIRTGQYVPLEFIDIRLWESDWTDFRSFNVSVNQ